MNFKTVAVFLLLTGPLSQSFAQIGVDEEEQKDRVGSGILDDTTKQVYGPKTTRFTYEANIKYNNPQYWNIDTLVYNIHQYQFMAREQNFFQDLGNIGTATTPIYPVIPDQIGATSGINIYDHYYRGPKQIKYYDTMSPYSDFSVIWGGEGRSVTEATYTRNIDERSNVGFDFRGLFIDKQIQRQGRGDRHAEGTYYTGYANYRTKNARYVALGSFIRNRQKVDEYGGILTTGNEIGNDVFFDEERAVRLTNIETDELRTNFHLYHHYKINDFIQLYHSFDRYKQQNDFLKGDGINPDTAFFDFVAIDSAINKDRTKIINRTHEVGFKGDIGKTFYSFYFKAREVDFNYKYLTSEAVGFETDYLETYAGFNLRFGNDSLSYISAYGEYMLGGEYRLGGEIRNQWFFARLASAKSLPGYLQRAYRGTHDLWVNNFDSPISSSLSAGVKFKLGNLTILPSAEYNLLSKYIYFRKYDVERGEQSVLPTQASGDINILKGQLDLSLDFLKVFNFNSKVIYANVSGGSANAVNVPEIFANAQVYYHNILFEGNLQWQIGVDVHMKTAYFAQGYDPAIMQFYIQDDFQVPFFPVADIFLSAKINRGRFFVKYNNFLQLFRENGYFLTPGYPAQTNILDFGFNWAFFD